MCGHVGIFGDISLRLNEIFNQLLSVNIVRGSHSTGVATISKTNKAYIVKKIGGPNNIFYDKEYREIKVFDTRVKIGHNRFATVGAVNEENTHPFECGNIVGAHNGTLKALLPLSEGNEYKFDTDSETLLDAVSRKGINWAWERMDGAAALVWWDFKEQSLNLARNDQRPLCFAFTEDKRTMFWASEDDMLNWILDRNNIKLQKETIYIPHPNRLFSFKLNDKFKIEATDKDLPALLPFDVRFPYKKWEPINFRNKKQWMFVFQSDMYSANKQGLTVIEFRDLYKECCWCGGKLFAEYATSVLVSNDHALCTNCAKMAKDSDVDIYSDGIYKGDL